MIEPLKDAKGQQIGIQAKPETHEYRQSITNLRALRHWVVGHVSAMEKRFERRLVRAEHDLLLMERVVDHCVEVVGQMRLVVEAPRASKAPTGLERIFNLAKEAGDYK